MMGSLGFQALVLVQLSVLSLSCLSVYGEEFYQHYPHPPSVAPHLPPAPLHGGHHHHHHHKHHPSFHHTPTPAPALAPHRHAPSPHYNQPAHPPARPPVHPLPPAHPRVPHFLPRKLVAVQGVVYCKPCQYVGSNTLTGASPLLGATVKLECNNSRMPVVEEAKTDKNGFFFIHAPKSVTTFGARKCKVFLVSPPADSPCTRATNLHDGSYGAVLDRLEKPPHGDVAHLPYALYTVGPFAFEPAPAHPGKCPR
ncbi:non-classical arabinogalactan protein 31 [Malania oleifera]|uniref:non-classical arabinogalactan protein 31 n=1 Tax=Malania oleifera TaxID=397392 RepID=UPI0025AEA505|nr:non-classical arabinogalactan protein 31 [Malania oleifera]